MAKCRNIEMTANRWNLDRTRAFSFAHVRNASHLDSAVSARSDKAESRTLRHRKARQQRQPAPTCAKDERSTDDGEQGRHSVFQRSPARLKTPAAGRSSDCRPETARYARRMRWLPCTLTVHAYSTLDREAEEYFCRQSCTIGADSSVLRCRHCTSANCHPYWSHRWNRRSWNRPRRTSQQIQAIQTRTNPIPCWSCRRTCRSPPRTVHRRHDCSRPPRDSVRQRAKTLSMRSSKASCVFLSLKVNASLHLDPGPCQKFFHV